MLILYSFSEEDPLRLRVTHETHLFHPPQDMRLLFVMSPFEALPSVHVFVSVLSNSV